MLEDDIAKECARAIMPLAWNTRMYMTGNVRSWLHYIQLRSKNGTQQEHSDVANAVYLSLVEKEPSIISFLNVQENQ
jgi:thymidylate synthase (FAD)